MRWGSEKLLEGTSTTLLVIVVLSLDNRQEYTIDYVELAFAFCLFLVIGQQVLRGGDM